MSSLPIYFNTIATPEDPPTYLLCPSRYNEKADTYSPLLFAHDGESFQSLLPKSEDDETRLVYLMTQHRSGGYQVKVKDLINKQEQISKNELIDKGLIDNIDNEVPEENNISDEEDNYEQNDPIQRQKFSVERPTLLVDDHPQNQIEGTVIECDEEKSSEGHKNKPVVVAPG